MGDEPKIDASADASEDASSERASSERASSHTDDRAAWERALDSERVRSLLTFIVPLLYYAVATRLEFTYGDGPELLTAAYKLGGAHPSGYPLFTLLGYLPAHVPWLTPYWNVSLCLSAIPSAIAALAIYRTLRRVDVFWPIALASAWAWAANTHVVYQATRVEVYSLHCMFIALALYALTRFATEDPEDEDRMRWAYLSVAFVCLGLTNHLTSVFLVAPVVIGLLLVDHRAILRLKTIAKMAGIAAACAAVYLYLPLQAMLNEGGYISWNDPQTWERFWFHVTGAEYSIFRRTDKMGSTVMRFFISAGNTFFSGILLIALVGLYEWVKREWRIVVVVLLFEVSSIIYMATFPIRDISTYYTALYIAPILLFGLGFDWFYRARFRAESAIESLVATFVVTIAFGWVMSLFVESYRNYYKEALAQDMSEQIIAEMEDPAVIFTSVDGHTFPMWYQTFVNHPERKVVVIDTVMFNLANKDWYRRWLRETYRELEWPSKDVALGNRWKAWLIDKNPDVNFYAILPDPWRQPGSFPVNEGWHHRLVRGEPDRGEESRVTRHIYTSRHVERGSGNYFYDSELVYLAGIEPIGCVVEWLDHSGLTGNWKFVGPDGKVVNFKPHPVPKGSNISWEFLEVDQQTPGEWRCEVEVAGEPTIVTEFELVK